MNKHEFKGLGKIFSFTLAQQFQAKGFVTTTLIFALICFLLPAIIIPITESSTAEENAFAKTTTIETVYVVDHTETTAIDFNLLNGLGNETFNNINYIASTSVEEASSQACDNSKAVILALDIVSSGYKATLLSTDSTELEGYEKDAFKNFLQSSMQTIMIYKSGIPQEALVEMTLPVQTTLYQGTDAPIEKDPMESIKEILASIIPYLTLMVLYFMILFYGQNIANIVIVEKTSKLMDTFLVSVKPSAMIFGKVSATIFACVLQFLSWILSGILGIAAGIFVAKELNPGVDLTLVAALDALSSLSGIFTLPNIIFAILMIILSFSLYCSIAAIGGALASKPEDLSSTNSIFTLILLASFFTLLYGGALNGNLATTIELLDIVPFTASMITPGKILLGYLSAPQILIVYGIMLLTSFIFLFVAGKLYKLMSLYKGDVPKPQQIIKMLTNK